MLDNASTRHWAFSAFTGLLVLAFHTPLYALLELSIGDFRYSHIAVTPMLSVFLVYFERKQVFSKSRRCLVVRIFVLLLGLIAYAIATTRSVARTDTLWLTVSAILMAWAGGLILYVFRSSVRSSGHSDGYHSDPRWEALVCAHPDGLIYRHPAYIEVIGEQYGQHCLRLACEDDDGELQAVMPMFHTRGVRLALADSSALRKIRDK